MNGCCERQNAFLTETFLKVRCDLGSLDDNLCLQTALFAKNCISSTFEYSPYRLIFGRLSRLPTVLDSEQPALNSKGPDVEDGLRKHLNALNIARKALIAAESSDN